VCAMLIHVSSCLATCIDKRTYHKKILDACEDHFQKFCKRIDNPGHVEPCALVCSCVYVFECVLVCVCVCVCVSVCVCACVCVCV